MGIIKAVLTTGECFLASKIVQTVAFSILADRVLRANGFGVSEFFLLMIVYVGISVKIDQIHAVASPIRAQTGGENG